MQKQMNFVPARGYRDLGGDGGYGQARAWPASVAGPIGDPFARMRGLLTRPGSGAWIRLGFIVPWEPERLERERVANARVLRHGCEAQRSGQRCHHHDDDDSWSERSDRSDRVLDEPQGRGLGAVLRYPLFGREIDFGRNQWEYHAWDTRNDVRIPVGVERRQWQLQNGDLVQLLGDRGLWAVVLTEFY